MLEGLHHPEFRRSEGKHAHFTQAHNRSAIDACEQAVILQIQETVPSKVFQQETTVFSCEFLLRARQVGKSPGHSPHDLSTGHKPRLTGRGDKWRELLAGWIYPQTIP